MDHPFTQGLMAHQKQLMGTLPSRVRVKYCDNPDGGIEWFLSFEYLFDWWVPGFVGYLNRVEALERAGTLQGQRFSMGEAVAGAREGYINQGCTGYILGVHLRFEEFYAVRILLRRFSQHIIFEKIVSPFSACCPRGQSTYT